MDPQLIMLRQLISGDFLSGNCIAVVVLIGLFVALLFRRESITSLGLFRMGYILFLLSLVIPSLVQSFFAFVGSSNGIRSGLSANGTSLAIYTPIGPIFLAAGLLCILGSLMPPRIGALHTGRRHRRKSTRWMNEPERIGSRQRWCARKNFLNCVSSRHSSSHSQFAA